MKYIHCSFDVVDEFVPRIPSTRCKIEDNKTPRICVAPDIRHCLAAMPSAGKIIEWTRAAGLPVILHAYYMQSDNVLENVTDKVADAEFTKEMWILDKPKSVRRIDYEITSCLVQDGKDINGDAIKRVICVEIVRVPFQDNKETVTECLKSLDNVPDEEVVNTMLKLSYSKLASNLTIEAAKMFKGIYKRYVNHKCFESLSRRLEVYREKHRCEEITADIVALPYQATDITVPFTKRN